MTRSTCSLSVEAMDTKTLSEMDLKRLNEVTQDMWASESWLGELAQCQDCGRMVSKEDVFGHLPQEKFSETVASLMREHGISSIECPDCRDRTELIYGPDNVEKIRERLKDSVSFLVVCRNEIGEMVGYMDGYVESLRKIFDRELSYHYSEIGFEAVRERVDMVLGAGYGEMDFMSFSSMGIIEKYANLFTIFKMFNAFFESVPDGYVTTPGITELDRNNNIHGIHKTMGCRTIWMADDESFKSRIANVGKGYESDIVVYGTPVSDFRENFAMGIKDFLKVYRKHR